MSHFYGTIDGQSKTQATRCGSRESGLVTHCASHEGAIRCETFIKNGIDWVYVEKKPWKGEGEYRVLYDGPIGINPQDTP